MSTNYDDGDGVRRMESGNKYMPRGNVILREVICSVGTR
jgi:hypothetical protein